MKYCFDVNIICIVLFELSMFSESFENTMISLLFFFYLWSGIHAFLQQNRPDGYTRGYEIVTSQIYHPRTKRSVKFAPKTEAIPELEVHFIALNNTFHLLLYEDTSFRKVTVSASSEESFTPNSQVYDGVLKDEDTVSSVSGYFRDGVFTGSVHVGNSNYFVEPAHIFLNNETYFPKIIVYRSEEDASNYQANFLTDFFRHHNWVIDPYPDKTGKKAFKRSTNPDDDYACEVELVADHTLYQHFRRSVHDVTGFLYLLGKHADAIFRKTDFDGNGEPDGIRIVVGKISVYKTATDPNYPMAYSAVSLKEFLLNFAKRTQNFCLSVCICARMYDDLVIGEAFKASTSRFLPAGICQPPTRRTPFGLSVKEESYNTAVMTIMRSNGQAYALDVNILSFAHEVAHGFGSSHDDVSDLLCSPGEEFGNYLMFPKVNVYSKVVSKLFSPCSRREMNEVIQKNGHCLKQHAATCGNGVREGSEQCDCGQGSFCDRLDHCCTPADAGTGGCKWRKQYRCSPKENPCCTQHCSVDLSKRICFDDNNCKISYCDGKSAECPTAKAVADGYPCMFTSKTCYNGSCKSNVCKDNGLEHCLCKNDSDGECNICCNKDRNCVTASHLGLYTPDGREYFRFPGSLCGNGTYKCTISGKCIDPNNRVLGETPESINISYIVGILVVVSIILMIVTVLAVYDRLNRSGA